MEGGPDDPEQPPSFPVVTLQGSPSSREVLRAALPRIRRYPSGGGETYAFTFRELNGMLDDICVGIGLDGMAGEAQWKEDWGRGCEFQADRLQQLMSDASPRVLIGAMRGERQVKTIVVDMCVWLERNLLGRLRELKKQTIENLRIYLNLETRVITSETVGSVQRARVLSIFNGIYLSATWKSWLIRALVSWTEDRGPEPRSVAWTPREKLLGAGDELPRFESDVYSLGMTIIEAMTQEPPFGVMDDEEIIDKIIIGEHYPKPKEATDDEWSLISQLCAVHMEDRISLEEAIDEIYKLQRREINFPVESLEGSPSSRKLLASITAKCERIPENEKLFRRLLERLERLPHCGSSVGSGRPTQKAVC
ncbi:Protein kinase-like domain [Phytophthora cactorum]|nr:Protein kinase-like domain [Phytophthora cactorum]